MLGLQNAALYSAGELFNPASDCSATNKGDVEVRAADLLGFFKLGPKIRVRGEVRVDYEYLATNNKHDTREVRTAASRCTSVNLAGLGSSTVPGLTLRATALAFRT